MARAAASLRREPLLHFLIGGVALFALYAWLAPEAEAPPGRIVVSAEQIQRLGTSFARTWLRPPSDQELQGLIDDFVLEEILYREALALGLDRNDLVVRRRMRQKMEFLQEELRGVRDATEAELEAFFEAHAAEFREPQRLSFVQLYVDPTKGDGPGRDRALRLLERARAQPALARDALGDATLLPRQLSGVSEAEIARHFGEAFARALAELPEETWEGPFASNAGWHVVRVTERRPSRMPPLEEIRPRVTREWEAEQRRESTARFHALLRERYAVEVQLPEAPARPAVASHAP